MYTVFRIIIGGSAGFVSDPDSQLLIQSQTSDTIEFRPALGEIFLAGTGTWWIVTNSAVSQIELQASGNPNSPVTVSIDEYFCTTIDTDNDGLADQIVWTKPL